MRILLSLVLCILPFVATADITSKQGTVRVDTMATGLDGPWALGFLPNGHVIVTEKRGQISILRDGKLSPVRGGPKVQVDGQGGLLDVLIPKDFAQTRQIYLTYVVKQGRGSGTAFGQGRLSVDGSQLINFTTLFEIEKGSKGGRHFGSRLAEGNDGKIYVTVGDRGDRPSAQDTSRENGSILRFNRDGTIPFDNPIKGSAIWSYGHRNPQGMAVADDGTLWAVEHGAKGGDELNRISKSSNYGWPIISYGVHYSGESIGEGRSKAGMEQPAIFWDPSIAPSGLMIYSGKLWPEWKGLHFTGSLKFDSIHISSGINVQRDIEIWTHPKLERIRDIREGPQGNIWVLSEGTGELLRLSPKN